MAGRGRAVLLDLDGTLTDPFLGISRSIQYAMERLGYPVPDAESLKIHIGPPLQQTFPGLLGSDDPALVTEAVRLYRERYADVGKFENTLIPGIVEAVEALSRSGYFLSLATSKLETYSREIVEHFGLLPFLDAVHGSQLDGTNADKSELIGHVLRRQHWDAADCIMVGDRLHDIVGAAKNGVGAIGVLWGFGDRVELETAGAVAIATTPAELPALVASVFAGR